MKNVGVPETPLSSALATSSDTRARTRARAAPRGSGRRRDPAPPRTGEVARRELVLVAEQQVVHLPELALGGGGLGRLGGHLGARVDVVERQVAPDVAHVVAVGRQQLADHLLGLTAVGALEVAVLEQRHRRVLGTADVVALGVDVLGEIEDVLGGAADLARPHRVGQPPDDREHDPADGRREHHSGERPEPRLVEAPPVNARLAISSETVKPMPAQAPPPSSIGPLSGGRGPCSPGRDASHEPAKMPIGLPKT